MTVIAKGTPAPPYYAVVFTMVFSAARLNEDKDAYDAMSVRMTELVAQQPGFLGDEREANGLIVSYWKDLESIRAWKSNLEHQEARKLGKEKWYDTYKIRIAKVEREYGM
jgi:heme-degrading monooxygenase HmoA